MLLFKIDSGVVLNVNYITAIDELENEIESEDNKGFKYIAYMTDKNKWYLTENDYKTLTLFV